MGDLIVFAVTMFVVLAGGLAVFFWWRTQYGVWAKHHQTRSDAADRPIIIDSASGWSQSPHDSATRPAPPSPATADRPPN
jgi:hypothetical protein